MVTSMRQGSELYFLWPLRKFKIFDCFEGHAAYKRVGRFFILAGAPYPQDVESQEKIIHRLEAQAHTQGAHLCGYYFSKSLVRNRNAPRIRLGQEAYLRLSEMSLRGGRWVEARRAQNFLRRKGWIVEFDQKWTHLEEAKYLQRKWRREKSFINIGFLLGDISQRSSLGESEYSCLLKNADGKALAFINYFKYFDEHNNLCVYIDNLLYDPGAHRLALSGLLVALAEHLKGEDVKKINLGLCPFVISKPRHWIEWLFRLMYVGGFFYNAKGLFHFKKRFATSFEDQYLLLDEDVAPFIQLFQLTRTSISI